MKNLTIILNIVLIMLLATASIVSAKTNDFDDANSITKESNGITFTVTYPNDIKCGVATEFKLHASGGCNDYKYRLGDVLDGDNSFIVDPSYMKYTDSLPADSSMNFTFYASGKYTLTFSVLTKPEQNPKSFNTVSVSIPITISDPNYPSVSDKAKAVAAECLKAGNNTDFDKALWLHDWIIENCKYDNSFTYCNPEGALCRGTGTCEAYHRAYAMLLDNVGIPNKAVTGNGHMWTAVKLDDKWYQVDSTWDDSGYAPLDSYESHLYFGLTDEMMKMAHSDHEVNLNAPCNSLDNNYFIKTGTVSYWSAPLIPIIQSHLNNGDRNFSIKIETSPKYGDYPTYDQYWKTIYNIVAYDLSNKRWSLINSNSSENSSIAPSDTNIGANIKLHATYDVNTHVMSFELDCLHTKQVLKKEETINSTYLKSGSYYKTIYCKDCGVKLSSTKKIIAKKCGTVLKGVKYKKNRKAIIKLKRNSKVTGYQVQYSKSSKFSHAKTKKVKGSAKTTITLKSLTKGSTYYIRVRTYTKRNYSGWSLTKKVKIKR